MDHKYQEVVFLIERLHRHFLEVLASELDRLGTPDINNIQALILFHIGDEELTVGELTGRGYYLSSNVSYNVKKLVETDYLIYQRSTHDRRSIRVRLSEKGLVLFRALGEMFERHIADIVEIAEDPITEEELALASVALRHLNQFWTRILTFGTRTSAKASMPSD